MEGRAVLGLCRSRAGARRSLMRRIQRDWRHTKADFREIGNQEPDIISTPPDCSKCKPRKPGYSCVNGDCVKTKTSTCPPGYAKDCCPSGWVIYDGLCVDSSFTCQIEPCQTAACCQSTSSLAVKSARLCPNPPLRRGVGHTLLRRPVSLRPSSRDGWPRPTRSARYAS